jgi:glycosyltransferase involved in cell wall biosynthesis
MITNAARHATALVVPTEAVGEELHELARRNLLSMRAPVRVVAHGLTSFPSGGELILDLPERYVLAIGTIEPRKGIEVLIEAMALLSGALLSRALLSGRPSSDGLNEAGPALLLVGRQGWGNVDPFALARKYGLPSHRIKVLNAMTDAELAAVLSRAAVVAIPSLAEGFGLPLVEAMAAGIPVVYSNVPALMEVAGGAGLCVPRKDPAALAKALERILTSSKLTQTLSSEGLTRSKDFSWHTSAEAIWRIHT